MVAGGMSDAHRRHGNMLRNLVLAALTALLVTSVASSARATRSGTARKSETVQHHGATDQEAERPARAIAPAKKKSAAAKTRSRARVVKRLKAAVMNQSLLRQSWTVADLNPMPALLDLDDTAQRLRTATAAIVRLMTR
jgi:hypothetical protein